MTCLTDAEIQTLADGEATATAVAHAAACERCRDRVDARRRDMAAVTALMSSDADVPLEVESRLRRAILAGRPARGATALRAPVPGGWGRAGWLSGVAVAAVVALVVFLLLPKLGAPTSLSASEVLGRSLKTMSASSGVEMLEYELVANDMSGPHRIEQLIDHDRPGRYRFSNYGPDGVLESSIGQDPASGHRVHLIRVDGRNFIIDLTSSGPLGPSLPEMGQAMIETVITMMQATSDQNLTIVDTQAGRQYVVEMPAVTPRSSAAMFDLYHARAVIDERDFRIQEFEASGAVLKQPYAVTFKLIRRGVRSSADVSADEFKVPVGSDDVVVTGTADSDPATDLLTAVLRELGKGR